MTKTCEHFTQSISIKLICFRSSFQQSEYGSVKIKPNPLIVDNILQFSEALEKQRLGILVHYLNHSNLLSYFQIEDLRLEISRREQEILQMATKMKTLEEQHQDYQKHIAVLKESLCAKEEHYTMLQTDVSSVHSQANRKVHSSLLIITS